MFSLHIQSYLTPIVIMDIVKEDITLVRSYATETIDGNRGNAFDFTECAPGERVWAKASKHSDVYRTSLYTSQFSGYLLHRL